MKPVTKRRYPSETAMFDFFENVLKKRQGSEHPMVTARRNEGLKAFGKLGFPRKHLEKWRNTDLSAFYGKQWKIPPVAEPYKKALSDIFLCEVHGFNTKVLSILNGHYYAPEKQKLITCENGLVAGSIAEAQKAFPILFQNYYGTLNREYKHGFTALNDALQTDGIFIYVPDNVKVNDTFQLIKILNSPGSMVNTRNMIVLGKNSKLTFLHCDDSVNHQPGFSNTVTEIFMEENSTLDLYKLQNLNDESVLLNHTFIRQHANSTLNLNVLSLNGGNIRNEIQTFLDGEGAVANLSGLYLADKKQHIDNQVYVRHNVPNCDSYELFKGILDDEATAVFNGYIFVERNAQQTNAFQKNSNILMKPSARINTMPFLEIYADDVKCSHGATVGQLDDEALFYMRQRGIPFKDARLLLLNAFTAEVSDKIDIEALRINIEDMVKRRLRGELSICDRCVLHCSRPEQPVEFDIDLSKI